MAARGRTCQPSMRHRGGNTSSVSRAGAGGDQWKVILESSLEPDYSYAQDYEYFLLKNWFLSFLTSSLNQLHLKLYNGTIIEIIFR